MRVRKKPVTVEAKLMKLENVYEIAEWCNGLAKIDDLGQDPYIKIFTLEGTVAAFVGDWVIKGVNGEFYPCKNDIFMKTYDLLEEEEEEEDVIPKKFTIDDITVSSIVDKPDGSAVVYFDMSAETINLFARIGLKKIILESANEFLKEEGECE